MKEAGLTALQQQQVTEGANTNTKSATTTAAGAAGAAAGASTKVINRNSKALTLITFAIFVACFIFVLFSKIICITMLQTLFSHIFSLV